MNESRGHWYLLTGFLIGIGIGLLIGWIISPVNYIDTAPYSLQARYKDEYRKLIALSYLSNGDIGRARERMALLQDTDPVRELSAQAQRVLAGGGLAADSRALSALAAVIGAPSGSITLTPGGVSSPSTSTAASPRGTATILAAVTIPATRMPVTLSPLAVDTAQAVRTATPIPSITPIPTVTQTPIATFTPRPSPTRLAYEFPFVLRGEKTRVCDSNLPAGIIQIYVTNSAGKPLPGVRIVATWKEGEDSFFTGLVPEITPGYADFIMLPDRSYTLKVGDLSEPVRDLNIPTCSVSGRTFSGGWKLEFTQK